MTNGSRNPKSECSRPVDSAPDSRRNIHWPFQHYAFIDYATQGYIAVAGLIILFGHSPRVPIWPMMLLAHAAGPVLVHSIIQFHARHPANQLLDFLRHFYPILFYAGFYHETGLLNQMLYTGYLDPHFLRLEKWLFGWQPGLEFMERCPSRLLSEVLYASYFSYYVMIGGVGLALLLRDRRQFAHYISVVSLVFYVCYLIFIFTPVVGPRILCRGIISTPLPPDVVPATPPATPESVGAGVFFQIMAWIYERFETPGAAFPSSHVAVAFCTLYFSFLYLRPIRWVHLIAAGLLCVSTVYGRYHYVVDVVAGVLTAVLLVPLGNRLFFKFRKSEAKIPTETRNPDPV